MKGIQWPDIWSDITAIFSQPRVGPLFMYGKAHRQMKGSNSHRVEPGKPKLSQALDEGHCTESETTWKDESRHNVTIAREHSKQLNEDWVFVCF